MTNQHHMPTHHPRIIGTRHMVASANFLAAQAGFEILEAGGNAIDAGVAAASRSACCNANTCISPAWRRS